MKTNIFIQARMNSTRFPGKVLAPVNGIPMISRVVSSLTQVFEKERIVIATSEEFSDDPLAIYGKTLGVKVFRGPLDNVFYRFKLCLKSNPCDWFFRICADSPLLNSEILQMMMKFPKPSLDLITNVQKRSFPHGHSAELINVDTFMHIEMNRLSDSDLEHVTQYYYSHTEEFKILNIENLDIDYAHQNFVVDTMEDLLRVEQLEKVSKINYTPNVKVSLS